MQASPVQLRSILYRKIFVEPQLAADGAVNPQLMAEGFVWDDVRLEVETGVGVATDQEDPTSFVVSLKLKALNEDGKLCPYRFEIEMVALIEVHPKLPSERRSDLAEVNGLAIVYSSMRELISNLTSRMEYGLLVLPGVNFTDHARAAKPSAPAPALLKGQLASFASEKQ